MRVGSGVILFQLAGFLTSALADFYFAKHKYAHEQYFRPFFNRFFYCRMKSNRRIPKYKRREYI